MVTQTGQDAAASEPQRASEDERGRWVADGVRQYAELLESTDPLAIAVQLALWQANHAQFLANTRAIDALGLSVSITGSRLAVMRTLFCAPEKRLPLNEISKQAGISPTMVTNLIDGLAKGGMVRRVGSDSDRRVSIAILTPEGEETFHKVLPVMSERMISACAGFSDEEKRQLLGYLQRLF
jgi:DNA-binding MarR family transcriptional regulator